MTDVIAAGTRHLFGTWRLLETWRLFEHLTNTHRRLIETRRLLGTRRLLEVLWYTISIYNQPTRSTQPCIPPGLTLTICGKGRNVTTGLYTRLS